MGKTKQNLPRGITIREHSAGQTINISFTFRGVRCREPLSNLPVTNSNIRYAERLLGGIKNDIERGIFDYPQQFPNSSKLKIFGLSGKSRTLLNYLDEYIDTCEKRGLSPSTLIGYRKCKTSLTSIHNVAITELTPAIIKQWVKNQNVAIKTIRNRLSVLRSSLDEAVTDGLIKINPASQVSVSRYKNIETDQEEHVDPFTPEEVEAIITEANYDEWANLFGFAFETGLRSSELCAIRWSSIDFIHKTASITEAKVVKTIKGTKTRAGTREIDLSEKSLHFLSRQKKHTFLFSEFIFHDPKTKQAWDGADAIRKKAWVPILKKAGVRYRNPYQTRHTFATSHISRGVNLFWLADQMGHKGPEMLFRHYGKYLKEYDGNTSKQVQKTASN